MPVRPPTLRPLKLSRRRREAPRPIRRRRRRRPRATRRRSRPTIPLRRAPCPRTSPPASAAALTVSRTAEEEAAGGAADADHAKKQNGDSFDLRRYVQAGVPHAGADELATVPRFEHWMRDRGLLGPEEHRQALELRESLRALLRPAPPERPADGDAAELLNARAACFPLVLQVPNRASSSCSPCKVTEPAGSAPS
jgi:Putative stress-induced transcription regulator